MTSPARTVGTQTYNAVVQPGVSRGHVVQMVTKLSSFLTAQLCTFTIHFLRSIPDMFRRVLPNWILLVRARFTFRLFVVRFQCLARFRHVLPNCVLLVLARFTCLLFIARFLFRLLSFRLFLVLAGLVRSNSQLSIMNTDVVTRTTAAVERLAELVEAVAKTVTLVRRSERPT